MITNHSFALILFSRAIISVPFRFLPKVAIGDFKMVGNPEYSTNRRDRQIWVTGIFRVPGNKGEFYLQGNKLLKVFLPMCNRVILLKP